MRACVCVCMCVCVCVCVLCLCVLDTHVPLDTVPALEVHKGDVDARMVRSMREKTKEMPLCACEATYSP